MYFSVYELQSSLTRPGRDHWAIKWQEPLFGTNFGDVTIRLRMIQNILSSVKNALIYIYGIIYKKKWL